MADLWIFAGIMALGQFSPGPDMLLLTRTSLAHGRAAGWWTTLGITTGLCVHAAVAIGGMAFLIAQGGWLERGMRWAAAAYLAWLGIRLCQSAFVAFYAGAKYEAQSAPGGRSFYVRGLLCNLLNPKAALFFAGVVAPFIVGERPAWWPFALWGVLVGEGLLLWGLWVWVLQFRPIRAGYASAAKWIDAFFGIGLLTLAVILLL